MENRDIIQVQQYLSLTDIEELKAELLSQWLTTKEGRTRVEYERNIKKFFKFLNENDYQTVRPHIVAEYKVHLSSRGLKASSINTYLAPVKDFFEWAYDMDYLHYNAGKHVRNIKGAAAKQEKARSLTTDETRALLESSKADMRHYVALSMLFNLGLRVSELTHLKVHHIDLHGLTIEINGKGSKVRVLGLNDDLVEILKEYFKARKISLFDNDYIVQSSDIENNTKPMSSMTISRIIKKYAKLAGVDLEGIKTHSGRVTAINHLLDKEVPMRDVANFAGHSNINTTRHYDRSEQKKVIQTCNIIKF